MEAELQGRGADIEALRALAFAGAPELQQQLKKLGYTKLGERAQVIKWLKPPVPAAAPVAAPPAEALPRFEAFDVNDDGGVLKTTLRLGTVESGRPPIPSLAKIRFVGTVLPSGQRFEAGVKEVTLGEKQVVRGLEKGIKCMHKGETAEIVLRSDYAYGEDGRGPTVPPGASVRYEVELISWVVPKKERS